MPEPTYCYACRQQRRLVWRNERTLYNAKCALTGKSMISSFPEDTPYIVYEYEQWWSDQFNALKYAQDYDFNKSFFEQFKELIQKVPRMNLSNSNNENCSYVNYTNYSKDSYLIYGVHSSEKCSYCWRAHHSLECYDCSQITESQYCYECFNCHKGYELLYSQDCQNCSQSEYLYNCIGCQKCYLCCNLNNKQYYILNKKYSPEEYKKKINELKQMSRQKLENLFTEHKKKLPHKAVNHINCEKCTGDYIVNSKNCKNAYFSNECEDCLNVFITEKAKDCMDCDITGWPAELCYEGMSTCVKSHKAFFSSVCWSCNDVQYCDSCFNSHDLFGCIGLKHNQYCILNKQYSKEEYAEILPKIIKHMKSTDEYGEFFPIELSPYPYNETIAQEYIPVTEEYAKAKNYKWTHPNQKEYKEQTYKIPKKIEDVNEDITENIMKCEVTDKNYKITIPELKFYKKMGIQIPQKHPDQRHKERMELRNPRKYWDRNCSKCGKTIKTSYPPENMEVVYCEACYLKEMY